jgi:hypothetical protein
METIDVLVRHDALEHISAVDLTGERQLDEDPIDAGIRVQFVDMVYECRLRRVHRKVTEVGLEASLLAVTLFAAHVDLGCGVSADENYRKTGTSQTRFYPGGYCSGELFA